MNSNGKESILATLDPKVAISASELLADGAGNFFANANAGGSGQACGSGCGTVFKLAADGTISSVYDFTGGNDGARPRGPLVRDDAGNFFGVTQAGGGSAACSGGCGTVFKITPEGNETILHAFDESDGADPSGGLLRAPDGYLYGTTYEGGDHGYGTVFRIKPD